MKMVWKKEVIEKWKGRNRDEKCWRWSLVGIRNVPKVLLRLQYKWIRVTMIQSIFVERMVTMLKYTRERLGPEIKRYLDETEWFRMEFWDRGTASLGLSLGEGLQLAKDITFGTGALDDIQFNKQGSLWIRKKKPWDGCKQEGWGSDKDRGMRSKTQRVGQKTALYQRAEESTNRRCWLASTLANVYGREDTQSEKIPEKVEKKDF